MGAPATRRAALLACLLWIGACGGEEVAPALSDEERGALEALGYINLVPAGPGGDRSGVTVHEPDRAHPGYNLFNHLSDSSARLMTMDGEVVHRWASDLKGRAYERFVARWPSGVPEWLYGWSHVEMLANGDLLVIGSHHMLLRLDWNSQPIWKLDISAHHDLDVAQDGTLYVLTDGLRRVDVDGVPVTIQDNYVVEVSSDGRIQREISLYDALAHSEWRNRLHRRLRALGGRRAEALAWLRGRDDPQPKAMLPLYAAGVGDLDEADRELQNVAYHVRPEDLFHANSVEVLTSAVPGLWRKGDLLLCSRLLDAIAVIDHESGRLLWSWGPLEIDHPHHATWLADEGVLMLFDNGPRRSWSRIVKVEPRSGEIVFEYQGDPPGSFFSQSRGGNQQLPNGNLLIAETDRGRAFEVRADGEIVWEYYSHILDEGADKPVRAAIYRMLRLEPSAVEPLLRAARPAASSRTRSRFSRASLSPGSISRARR